MRMAVLNTKPAKVKSNKDRTGKIPFGVVRSSRATLVEQVAGGLRRSISSGFYKAGDILPTTRELADALGVSRIVTRAAIAELARDGLVNPKPGVGCAVLGRGGRLWKGNVLFVSGTHGRTFYVSVFINTLRALLVKEGWLLTQVSAVREQGGATDVSELELQLSSPVALAIVMFDNPAAERVLSRAGVPFVTLGNRRSCRTKGCVGNVYYDRSAAASELVSAAVNAGVKSVLQVGMENFDDVGPSLKMAGIRASVWKIPVPPEKELPVSVSFAVRDAFASKLARSRRWLADMVYFSDDHACTGALAALSAAHVRIPEELRVATWANLGNGPVFGCELTRVEMAPAGDAERFAKVILDRLEGKSGDIQLVFGPIFKKGDTL